MKKPKNKLGQKILSTLLALLVVVTSANPGSMVAHAEEQDRFVADGNEYSVTLTQTETSDGTALGEFRFKDGSKDVKKYKSGETVVVNYTVAKDYVIDRITVVTKDGVAINTKDSGSSLKFTMPNADVSVLVTILPAKTEREPLDVKKDTVDPTLSYILENMDSKYVGSGDKLNVADIMTLALTVIESGDVKTETLDGLWLEDANNDGIADNWRSVVNQTQSQALLYEVAQDSKYFVGFIDTLGTDDVKLVDWLAGQNSTDGIVYDDIVFDETTGLIYVPKTYRIVDEDGTAYIDSIRTQILYVVKDRTEAKAEFNLNVTVDGLKGKFENSGTVQADIGLLDTTIQLTKNKTALNSIKNGAKIVIALNGVEIGPEMYEFDSYDGKLTLMVAPTSVDTLDVVISTDIAETLEDDSVNLMTFTEGDVMATSVTDGIARMAALSSGPIKPHQVGEFTFDKMPVVGDTVIVNGTTPYTGSGNHPSGNPDLGNGTPSYTYPYGLYHTSGSVESTEGVIRDIIGGSVSGIKSWSDDLRQNPGVGPLWNNIQRAGLMNAQTATSKNGTEVTIPNMSLNLFCSHIGISLDFKETGGNLGGDNIVDKLMIGVVEVNADSIIFAVVTPTTHTQAGIGMFSAPWVLTEQNGHFTAVKHSANPEYTNGNDAYDLAGAEYQMYENFAMTIKAKPISGTLPLVTNSAGKMNTVELKAGTYYMKETKAPKGYDINPRVVTVEVKSGETVTQQLDGVNAEPPLFDPVGTFIQKAVDEMDQGSQPNGDIIDFSGAEFRFTYYAGLFTNEKDAKASGKKKATAVWVTDTYGDVDFSVAPISGSWPYKDAIGANTVPLGTIIVTEEKGIPGTVVDGAGQIVQFVDNGDRTVKPIVIDPWSGEVSGGSDAIGAFANTSIKGGLTIVKADTDLDQSKPQGDATLENVTYTIYNRSKSPVRVKVGDKWVDAAVGAPIMEIKTKIENGKYVATTGEQVLPFGTYEVVETAASTGYNNNAWKADFVVDHDGQMISYENSNKGWNRNDVLRYGVLVGKIDRDSSESTDLGDATLKGANIQIYNRSKNSVVVDGKEIAPNGVVGTLPIVKENGKYVARSRVNWLPYGKYEAVEIKTSDSGYLFDDVSKAWKKTFTVGYSSTISTTEPGTFADLTSKANAVSNQIMKGGVRVTKVDKDWNESKAQGAATLDGVQYVIYNRSKNPVFVDGKMIAVNSPVTTITSKFDRTEKIYVAQTADKYLPYGTYEIVETVASVGYENAGWKQTFTVRQDGQVARFDSSTTRWNANAVLRYGVVIGKIDRETNQYLESGGASLEGVKFEIINRSDQAVYVDGKTYEPGQAVGRLSTAKEVDADGNVKYVARSAKDWLPYGKYEVREIDSGNGYLFDDISKNWKRTFSVGYQSNLDAYTEEKNGYAYLTSIEDAASNQVMREDFHFQKKLLDNDMGDDIGALIPFVIESKSTGEKHVIVTDENGGWGSAWYRHSKDTNSNDPLAPNSNGAIKIHEDGTYYVADESKLNPYAGTWFTGMPEDITTWLEDGTSYMINDVKVNVNDKMSSFPYDRYTMTELEVSSNEGYHMLTVNVTLTHMGKDEMGGLDYDYGTINNRIEPQAEIGTELSHEGGLKLVPNDTNVTITDTVEYLNLRSRRDYTLKGELHFVDAEGVDQGVVAEAEAEFKTNLLGYGTHDVVFTDVDTTGYAGGKLVAFEYLYLDGKRVAEHADIEDEFQTVYVPEIGTTLTGDIEHEADGSSEVVVLTDRVEYKNLIVGKTYTMSGTLQYQETDADGNIVDGGVVLDINGEEVVASTEFTPVEKDGFVDITFEFETDGIAGKTVVAFETLSYNDITYATHTDITDEAQTVYFPSVDTHAQHKDGGKMIPADTDQVIVDTVTFDNLVVGKEYTVIGDLRLATVTEDGILFDEGSILDERITTVFTAEATSQDVETEFTIDATDLGGSFLVAYQELYRDGIKLGEHIDINAETQRVHVPKIKTELTRLGDGSDFIDIRDVEEDGTFTLVDTIAYENLTPNETYRMEGTLHLGRIDEETHSIIDEGEMAGVLGSTEFTPDKSSGLIDVEFTFEMPDELTGYAIVAFEKLFDSKGRLIAIHEDITDEKQTVVFGKIETQAVSETTEMQMVEESESVRIIDTVEYTGLTPGVEYVANGKLHIQEIDEEGNITNGGIMLDKNGEEVVGSTTFIPTSANGTVDVVFEFEVPEDFYDMTLVVFEEVQLDGITILRHEDINDDAQTIYKMRIGTTATGGDGEKEIGHAEEVNVIDVVEYENLLPGYEYTLTGTLMVKHEDGTVTVAQNKDGEEAIGQLTFTPEEPNGSVEMVFTVNTVGLSERELVVFERISVANGTVIGIHEDINDEGQTVTVEEFHPIVPLVPATPKPQVPADAPTNALKSVLGVTVASALGAAAIGAILIKRRRDEE